MKEAIIRVLTTILLAMPLIACEQSPEGPAERAGERIDEAVEEGKETVDSTVERAGEKLEEAGDTIQEKTEK